MKGMETSYSNFHINQNTILLPCLLRTLADQIETQTLVSKTKLKTTVEDVSNLLSEYKAVLDTDKGSAYAVGKRKHERELTEKDKENDNDNLPLDFHPIVRVSNLNFSYKSSFATEEKDLVLRNINLEIFPNQRIVLVGANGCGKSSILRCLSGNHLSRFDRFEVNGTKCKSNSALPWADQFRGLAYLGGVWRRSGGFNVLEAYSRDIAVRDMMKDWQTEFPERRDVLVKVLGINMDWRMHQVSDGQRKKVRIMLKLLRPFKLCVIDEFAAELDIMARKRFFDYLESECESRGAAVIFATHIFDSPKWATHVAFVHNKTLGPVHELKTYNPYQQLLRNGVLTPMYQLVLSWLIYHNGGSVTEGDTNESAETRDRPYMPYDSGYESGRSNELFKAVTTTNSLV